MKQPNSLFEENISSKHRKQVYQQAQAELKELRATDFSLKSFFHIGLATTALLTLIWWSSQSLLKSTQHQVPEQVAFLETDPELLENLDWLEDLEIIEDLEELETWTSS